MGRVVFLPNPSANSEGSKKKGENMMQLKKRSLVTLASTAVLLCSMVPFSSVQPALAATSDCSNYSNYTTVVEQVPFHISSPVLTRTINYNLPGFKLKNGNVSWKQLVNLIDQQQAKDNFSWPTGCTAQLNPVSQPVTQTTTTTQPADNSQTQTTGTSQTQTTTTQPADSSQAQTATQTSSDVSNFAQQVVDLVNQQRAANGLAPLTMTTDLTNVAQMKANDMLTNKYFDHTSPDLGSPFDLMKAQGVNYSYAGENIAMGQATPQEVMTDWMNSPGHRANILDPNYTQIGIGVANSYQGYGYIWVQEFDSPLN